MWWLLLLTIVVYLIVRHIAIRINHPLFNPLVIVVLILVPLLLVTGIPYQQYAKAVRPLNDLLAYSVVALAYPMYELFPQIKVHWRSVMFICFSGSIVAIISGYLIAYFCGASAEFAASILPKSVTTPIAVMVSDAINGIPSITAFCVVVAGVFGACVGYPLLNVFRINSPMARGLSIGAISHAVGTARCMEENYTEGAFSTLALALCGIMTSLLAPLLYTFLSWLCY